MRAVLAGAVLAAAVCGAAARAQAKTELCPASLHALRAVGAAKNAPSAAYGYDLFADTARTVVEASLIADTDAGWYSWKIGNAPLEPVMTTVRFRRAELQVPQAVSAGQTVVFPVPVRIRHAWVTAAQVSGDQTYHWDGAGMVACEVPSFTSRGGEPAERSRPQSSATKLVAPVPVPSPPPLAQALTAIAARAQPAPPPFSMDCDVPFRPGALTHASTPPYPQLAAEQLSPGGSVSVLVSLDETGALEDSWVYASTGNPLFERAALQAARSSTYEPAISYCQKVKSQYIFNADFIRRS